MIWQQCRCVDCCRAPAWLARTAAAVCGPTPSTHPPARCRLQAEQMADMRVVPPLHTPTLSEVVLCVSQCCSAACK